MAKTREALHALARKNKRVAYRKETGEMD